MSRKNTRGTSAVEIRLVTLASTWEDEAQRRRRVSAQDMAADVMAFCASELREEIQSATDDDADLSPEEYGALHGKSAATVRRWCKGGVITARLVGREYRIRRGEPCPDLRLGKIS